MWETNVICSCRWRNFIENVALKAHFAVKQTGQNAQNHEITTALYLVGTAVLHPSLV